MATKPGVLLGSSVERVAAADPALAAQLEQARRLGDTDLEAEMWEPLMSSPIPGHAMRADDPAPGTILGKALESLETGSGRVRMLVMLR